MNKILDFFNKNKYVFIWTVCYAVVIWAILYYLFNFNIFNSQQWVILMHARLRGFPGFVFGLLILAAIPMYIATTSIIWRTKKPLFTIPLPKFMEPVPAEDASKTEQAVEPEKETEKDKDSDQEMVPEKILPAELRSAFIKARTHIGPAPKSNFDITNLNQTISTTKPAEQNELQQMSELPLPNDFELAADTINSFDNDIPSFSPIFSDIDFDNSNKEPISDTVSEKSEEIPEYLNSVIEHLTANHKEFFIENGLIITATDIIAVHDDADFWIADEETWFASGKQKPSPAKEVLIKSAEKKLRPVLYLGKTNILDLENRQNHWSESGIQVITDLDEIK